MRSGLRVAAVETEVLEDPANPQLLVHVTAEDGTRGTGETWWGIHRPDLPVGDPVRPYQATIDHLLGPLTIGARIETIADIEDWWHRVVRAVYQYGDDGIARGALSGIDIALWDLLARHVDVPVAALLGGIAHDRIPVYASLSWLGDADAVCADIDRAAAAGFTAVKLHESDPDLVLEVRQRTDAAMALMLDVSARYDTEGGVELVRRLDRAGLVWIEEPVFPQRDHAALAAVARAGTTPLAAGENELSCAGLAALASSGAVRTLQPEVAKIGGLTEARAVGPIARDAGCGVAPHNFSMGPSWLASWHLAAHLPETTWLEVPWLPAGATFPGATPMPVVEGGTVHAPTGVGLTG